MNTQKVVGDESSTFDPEKKRNYRFVALTGDGSEFASIMMVADTFAELLAQFEKAQGPVMIELEEDELRILQAMSRATKTFSGIQLLQGEQVQQLPNLSLLTQDFALVTPDAVHQLLNDKQAVEATSANRADQLLRRAIEKHTSEKPRIEPETEEDALTPDAEKTV